MDWWRQRPRVIGWLAAVALVANALAMAACPLVPADSGTSPFGPLVICTPEGLKTLDGEGGGTPAPKSSPCAHCASTCAASTVLLAALVILLVGPSWVYRLPRPAAPFHGPAALARAFRSRAPPLPV